jgi:hypothetical protein
MGCLKAKISFKVAADSMDRDVLLPSPPPCALLPIGKIYVDFLISPRIM